MTIGLDAKCAVLLNDLFPGAVAGLMSAANRLLPSATAAAQPETHAGHESESALAPSWLTRLSQRAAVRKNGMPP